MKYSQIVDIIEDGIAPIGLMPPWDNSGTQICANDDTVRGILCCLDLTDDVILEAIETDCNMIVAHHPLIFTAMKSIDISDGSVDKHIDSYICRLIKEDIFMYAAHLTFDNSPVGNCFYLGNRLGLKDIYMPLQSDNLPGVIGHLKEPVTLKEFLQMVARALEMNLEDLSYVAKSDADMVQEIGVCTGAGGDFVGTAMKEGCDLLLTGEVKLHQAQMARACGFRLIDGGHYNTEKSFSRNMAALLRDKLAETPEISVKVLASSRETSPFRP